MLAAVDRSSPDEIHPSLWRASQLARGNGHTVDTGYASLSAELPGGGWPLGALIELLPAHSGIGELRLLQPALASLGKRPIGLIEPPHPLYGPGLGSIGLPLESIVQIRAPKMADKLRAAEQMLRTGSFRGVAALASAGPAGIAETAAPRGTAVGDPVYCGPPGVGRNASVTSRIEAWPAASRGRCRDRHPQATRTSGCEAADGYSAASHALFTSPAGTSPRSCANHRGSGRGPG
jgi:hypothetical protein